MTDSNENPTWSFIRWTPFYVMDDEGFLNGALDQPLSPASTFWESAKNEALHTPGLGTAIREMSLPSEAPTTPEMVITPPDGTGSVNVPDTPQMRRRITAFQSVNPDTSLQARQETPAELQRRQEEAGALSEDSYKASPYFRPNIPWQNGMTSARAAALADQDDLTKVREYYASKRPVTAFFGGLAGAAADPINYIPIAGEAVTAANVARFGSIAGRALTSSIDAAANTGLAAVATAPMREKFGDDVSLQSTVSQIAMSALVGGAFGAVAGRLSKFRGLDGEPRLHSDLLSEAETKLATLDNVQVSRVALNDALHGLINGSEVNLSPASANFVSATADQQLPKIVIERMARDSDPEAFDRLSALDRTFEINDREIRNLQSQTLDNERFGPTRAAMIEADRLAERVQSADDAVSRATSDAQRAIDTQRAIDAREALRAHLATIDDPTVQQIEDIDAALSARRQSQAQVAAERQELQQRVEAMRATARDQYWAEVFAKPRFEPVAAADAKATDLTTPIDLFAPAPVQDDPVLKAAAKRARKLEAPKALADQFRVNPETGDFPELEDVDRLFAEGRVSDEDRALFEEADAAMKSANAYGEAVKAFASCAV